MRACPCGKIAEFGNGHSGSGGGINSPRLSIPPPHGENRLLPVLAIRNEFPDAIISVDTWHAETARIFLANGAAIINDVSACFGTKPGRVLADAKPGYVLMHSQGRPSSCKRCHFIKMLLMKSELSSWPWIAWLPSGCRKNIVLDPGIGFGKKSCPQPGAYGQYGCISGIWPPAPGRDFHEIMVWAICWIWV